MSALMNNYQRVLLFQHVSQCRSSASFSQKEGHHETKVPSITCAVVITMCTSCNSFHLGFTQDTTGLSPRKGTLSGSSLPVHNPLCSWQRVSTTEVWARQISIPPL